MKNFTVDWFSDHIPNIKPLLSGFEDKDPIKFIEIGSFEGRSTCWFFENYIQSKKNSTLTCIDTWSGSMENTQTQKDTIWDMFNKNISDYPKDKIIVERGLSREILKRLHPGVYDFIYIDGSHTSRDVLEDAVLGFDLLKVGGIMLFDDYMWQMYPDQALNPKLGINAFLASYSKQLSGANIGYQLSVSKIAE